MADKEIGDDALAAGMELVAGTVQANTIDTEINRTRDYVAQRTSDITPIDQGGTGATTPEGARTNLVVPGWDAVSPKGEASAGGIARYSDAGRLQVVTPVGLADVVNISWAEQRIAAIPSPPAFNGGVVTGQIYLPNASTATSGYTTAYINSDGRISRGASSERYKERISDVDPAELGDVFPQLARFQMRDGDGSWKYGYIAERLDEHDDTKPYVVSIDGTVESIDFIQLLLVQVAQLHARVTALEAQRHES